MSSVSFASQGSFNYQNVTPPNGVYSIGMAPSAWGPGYYAIEMPGGALSCSSSFSWNTVNITSNLYNPFPVTSGGPGNWYYLVPGQQATCYTQQGGSHFFNIYPAVAAGGAATAGFTALWLNSNTNVQIYGSLSLNKPTVVSSSSYTLGSSESALILTYAGTVTLTLGNPGSYPGRILWIKQGYTTSQIVNNNTSQVVSLNNSTTTTSSIMTASNKCCMLQSDGNYWQIMQLV